MEEHLKDEKPKWYRQMKKEGTLRPYLSDQENRMFKQMDSLIDRGLNESEATEMVWEECMSLSW